jgi:hypothetical protein
MLIDEVALSHRKVCEVIKYFFVICPKEITVERYISIAL